MRLMSSTGFVQVLQILKNDQLKVCLVLKDLGFSA